MRISRHIAAGLALSLSLLAACGGDSGGGPVVIGDPVQGGTAIVAVTSDFQPFNPVTSSSLLTLEVNNFLLYTPLIQFGEDLEAVPALAESWDLEDTGVTFHLRDDLQWHDGQPVTAEDVAFTFELAKNPQSASLLESAYLNMIEAATVIDPQTIRFDFTAPHSQPLQAFWWAPLPRHLLENVSAGALAQDPFGREPVGNGPFRFVEWSPGEQLTLEANETYPEELGGRPMVDRVVFRVVPEATTRLTEVLTGAIDINYTLQPDEARQVEGQNGVRLASFPGRAFLYLGWNNEVEPFTDARVRRALSMAVDRQAIIDALMFGYAEPASGMIPNWSPLAPAFEVDGPNVEAARQLLQEAGYAPGPNGVMQRNGQPLQFTLLTSEDRLRQDVAVVLQEQLRAVGASVEVRAAEFTTMLQQHRQREYQAVLSEWTLDNFRVDPTPLFSCAEAEQVGSANRAGYCNPAADELAMQGTREGDRDAATAIWTEYSRLLDRDQPITFLVWQEQMSAINQRLQGVEMDVRGKLRTAQDWWIPEGQQR